MMVPTLFCLRCCFLLSNTTLGEIIPDKFEQIPAKIDDMEVEQERVPERIQRTNARLQLMNYTLWPGDDTFAEFPDSENEDMAQNMQQD